MSPVGTDRFAKRGEAIDDRVPMRRQVDGVGLRGGKLERGEPPLDPGRRLRHDLLGGEVAEVVARDPDVGTDAVPDGAAEQLVDGDAVELPDDVPERYVDCRLRARENRAAAQEARAADHLPVRLDPRRVRADQEAAEVVDGCLDGRWRGTACPPRPSP